MVVNEMVKVVGFCAAVTTRATGGGRRRGQ